MVVYLPTLHMPIKKMKTSLFNLLNHKEQKLPKRKKVSAEAKFQQMPQTSISTFTTFSDMRVNLTSGHVPHLAREYRLIRSSGPIEGNATRPFHKGVAFWIKNRINLLTPFFLEFLREDLEVYGEKNFTYFRSVTSSTS